MKKILLIFAIIITVIFVVITTWPKEDPKMKAWLDLGLYSKEEIFFLSKGGFLNNLKVDEVPEKKEVALSLLKSPTLVEQKLDSSDEYFEILATKVNAEKNTYNLAFKLENKSNKSKEFYLLPISKDSQTEFQGISGIINNINSVSFGEKDVIREPLDKLYDVSKHKQELSPKLAKAYDDITNNNYQAKPIKITLDAKTVLLGESNWQIKSGQNPADLEPVYFLVHGSAGGLKDDLNQDNLGKLNYKNEWIGSYETVAFDTPDGDLDFNEYALTEDGKGYYIRTKSKNEAQFEQVDLDYDISKLQKVNITGKAYYDKFQNAAGKTVRIKSNAEKYNGLRHIKNYPQPERIELVTQRPPSNKIALAPTHHSIAYDAVSNSGDEGSVSSYSWSHTVGAGSSRLLAIGTSHYGTTTNPSVNTITYNGDSATEIREDYYNTIYMYNHTSVYYLIAPDSGSSYTVSVTLSGTAVDASGGAVSYQGAKQSGQPDANNGSNGSSSSASTSVTTVADNCWVFSVVAAYVNLTCNNTSRWNLNGTYDHGGSDTNGPKTPAGSQTMSWGLASSSVWAISAASFAPASGTAALTGTVTSSIKETDIVAGGKTIILTLTGDTWVADGDTFNAQRQNIIDGIGSAQIPGPNSGGTFANDSTVGSRDWTNMDYAVSSNNEKAYVNFPSSGITSHYLKATNFGFDIPTEATVDGILVEVEKMNTDDYPGVVDSSVKIVKGGTIQGDNKSLGGSWPTSDAYYSYGDSSDLWGLSWTAADINSSDFGMAISVYKSDSWGNAQVDHIRITVYYHITGTSASEWDAHVKTDIPVTDVVRTSDTVVTITLSAQSDYDIAAPETIAAMIPATALTGGAQIVATPTFTIGLFYDPIIINPNVIFKNDVILK